LFFFVVVGSFESRQRFLLGWMWWPAIGAVFVGVGGWIDPRVLGVGYDLIHGLLRGEILLFIGIYNACAAVAYDLFARKSK
jgi:H+/Cl- antiporter ClcA